MTTFLLLLFLCPISFGLGYYVNGHPADARAFMQKIRDALGRLIHRNP